MFLKVLFQLTLLMSIDGLKILVVFPTGTRSHVVHGESYVRELNRAGHHVTFMTPFPTGKITDLMTEVDISFMLNYWDNAEIFNVTEIIRTRASSVRNHIAKAALESSRLLLQNDVTQRFLRDKTQKFDVIVAEWFLGNVLVGLGQVFRCPIVMATTSEITGLVVNMVEHLQTPAVIQSVKKSLPHLNFMDRLDSLIDWTRNLIQNWFVLAPGEKILYESLLRPAAEARGVTDILTYEEAVLDISLVFYSSHPSFGLALSLPANVIPIGGFHIPRSIEPLPKDLQHLMDTSKDGVILFSMGSILKSKDLPTEVKIKILNIFGKLNQTVFWKFEENLPNKPDNVHIRKWFPQHSILAHPNLRMLICHSGFLSLIEAVHFGVPVLGIPIFGDHFRIMETAARKGYGVAIQPQNLIYDLEDAIDKVLTNDTYTKTAKRISSYYHDRPSPPGEELVYWIEHVARTKGAPHLRSATRHVTVIEYLYLDLLAVVVLVIILVVLLVKKISNKLKLVYCKKPAKSE